MKSEVQESLRIADLHAQQNREAESMPLTSAALAEVQGGFSNQAPVQIDTNQSNWIDAYLLHKLEQQAEELQRTIDEKNRANSSNVVTADEHSESGVSSANTGRNTSNEALPSLPVSRVWGIDFHCVNMEQTLDRLVAMIERRKPSIAITANLNYAMLCDQHPRLAELTRRSDLVLCDGMPIYWRSLANENALPDRVAGSDLIYRLSERCADQGLSIYFYGAAPGVAQLAADRLKTLYPKLRVAGVQCPPFHATSIAEQEASLHSIRTAKPDVLLVALGQPKGEFWIEDHLSTLGVPVCIQVGASFDFVAGNCDRAPRIFQITGLEWFYRLLHDPKRLGPRYLKNIWFLLKALRRDLLECLS